jgi:hypothetical protein
MADIDQDAQAPDGTTFTRRLEDQGDGTHAPGSVLYLRKDDGTYVEASANDDGQFHVVLMGKVDDTNSSATLLDADAVFTGTATSTLDFGYIFVTLFSDVASATDGVSFQQSSDGTNWDNTDDFSYVGGTGKTYSIQPGAKWFRIVYTNGGTDQASFRLQTIFKKTSSLPSSHRISDDLSTEDDATLGISIIKGQKPNGDYTDFSATAGGNFKISLEEFDEAVVSNPVPVRDPLLEIARDNVTGVTCISKFGAAPGGIETTATDIWSRADGTPTQQIWLAPTAARIHTIASTSAADDTGSTGVDTVVVHYLPDWDTAETTETVTGDLNAGVGMQNAAVMIHRMVTVPQATTTNVGGNVGTITATAASDSTITAVIDPGDGQTEMAIYGVPSVQDFYLTRWSGDIDKVQGAATSCDFALRVNPNPNTQTLAFIRKQDASVQSTGNNSFERNFECYPKFSGPCIIKVQGVASAGDTDGHSSFDGYLVTK